MPENPIVPNIPSLMYPPGLPGPYPSIVPFSIRENPSMMHFVEQMREWLNNTLIPYINNAVKDLSQAWKDYAELLIAAWDAKMTELEAEVAAAVASIGDRVAEAEAAKVAAQAAQAAAEAARDQAAIYASEAEAIQDTAITGIFNNATSAFRHALDGVYASKTDFNTLNDVVQTGRLSQTALDADYAGKAYEAVIDAGRLSPAGVEISRGSIVDNDYADLAAAYAATPLNGTLEIRSAHVLSDVFTIDKSITVLFRDAGKLTGTDVNKHIVTVTADNVTIINANIVGAGAVYGLSRAINVVGGKNAKIRNFTITDIPYAAVFLDHADGFSVTDGTIRRVGYAGVLLTSATNGSVERVSVTNVLQPAGFVNSYGFAASRLSSDPVSTSPVSSNVRFVDCTARNVDKWEGFDTHGGVDIQFINCRAYSCRVGFAIVGIPDTSVVPNTPGTAAKNFTILNCYAESPINGLYGAGLSINGTYDGSNAIVDEATGTIDGMTIVGGGIANGVNEGATYINGTRGLAIANLRNVHSRVGILFGSDNNDFNIISITVLDPFVESGSTMTPVGIGFRSQNNNGSIASAILKNTGKYSGDSTIRVLDYGLRTWTNVNTLINIASIFVFGALQGEMSNSGLNSIAYRMNPNVKFVGGAKQVNGAKGANSALGSLITQLVALGLITDNTTA